VKWRVAAFVVLCVLAVSVSVAYVVRAANDADAVEGHPARRATALARLPAGPRLVFRSNDLNATYGRVGVVSLAAPERAQATTGLPCERVDMARGRGLCLQADRGVLTRYRGVIFDDRFRMLHSFPLAGSPSRARLSQDGKLAAYTVFVTGHSYASSNFSTRTAIVDTGTGEELAHLEQFTTRRDGRVFRRVDFNFWGVTFTRDPNRFYATLGTGGDIYLVAGDLARRTFDVVAEDVECPSISPDGTRLAFKRRSGGDFGPVTWRVSVFELASGRVTPLAERRNVDDQIEWLDDEHVLYGLRGTGSARTDVWRVNADGSGRPARFLTGAWSPSVVSG